MPSTCTKLSNCGAVSGIPGGFAPGRWLEIGQGRQGAPTGTPDPVPLRRVLGGMDSNGAMLAAEGRHSVGFLRQPGGRPDHLDKQQGRGVRRTGAFCPG